jgi:hypothetical protein
MQKELIAEVQALQKKMDAIENNPATWKVARKLQSAADILQRDWVDAPPANVAEPKAAKK